MAMENGDCILLSTASYHTSHQNKSGTMARDEEAPAAAGEESSLLPESNGPNARKAYESGSIEESKKFHDKRHEGKQNEEAHQEEGGSLKSVIFGGLDGILTSFAIVSGAAGGNLSTQVILVLGFSNIFADALSMGVGEFLSSKAENEWILSERKREAWEMENYPEGEIEEMVDIYVERGMVRADAVQVITTMSKYKDFFVDVMMAEELQLQVPEEDHEMEAMKEGVVMFCSFAIFGAMPLLGYAIFPASFPHWDEQDLFAAACVITGAVLFLMGCVKSLFSTSRWYLCGLETFLLGGACATVAYTLGQFVDSLLPEDAK